MKNKNGFTVIELIVVISVIVLLTALVMISLRQVRIKANNSRIKNDMDQLRKQAEVIYAANGMVTYCVSAGNSCFETANVEVGKLSDDIDIRNGSGGAPTINKNASAFCIDAVLADSTKMCYDSTGKQTYGGAIGTAGTCNVVSCR